MENLSPNLKHLLGEHAPIPSSLENLQQSNLSVRALTPSNLTLYPCDSLLKDFGKKLTSCEFGRSFSPL